VEIKQGNRGGILTNRHAEEVQHKEQAKQKLVKVQAYQK